MMLFIVAVIALALVVLALALARREPAGSVQDLSSGLKDVDIQAFRRLIDENEIAYLRHSVPPETFRRLQRKRARVAWRYLDCISQNASLLTRASSVAGVQNAEAAAELEREALQVRWLVLRARIAVALWFVAPGVTIRPSLSGRYTSLRGHFEQMLRASSDSAAVS
jgi:hypothetical protein